ncbi:hypothetical protein AOZ07_01700 [Glutamicibacter halophytocola]|nr:hypothetical protein AOZ07_01700 [Glutamicibacter halophytocola]
MQIASNCASKQPQGSKLWPPLPNSSEVAATAVPALLSGHIVHHVLGSRIADQGIGWEAAPASGAFEPNSGLRALAEVYAPAWAKQKFVKDFAAAWTNLMDADRFELRK